MKPVPLEKSDIDLLKALQPEGWSDIRRVFQFYLDSPFCHPFTIRVQGSPAGIGSVALFGQTAWLAHIIVHTEFRNQGMGLCLTNYLKDLAMSNGEILLQYLRILLKDQSQYPSGNTSPQTSPSPHFPVI